MEKQGHDREQSAAPEPATAASQAAEPAAGGMAGAILGLQRAAGNAAVTRMLLRGGEDSGGGVGTAPPASGTDKSSAGGPAVDTKPDFQKLIDEKDTGGIEEVDDFTGAQPEQLAAMNEILLHNTWWVGDSDRRAIHKMWATYSVQDLPGAYSAHKALWDESVAKDVDLWDLPALKKLRDSFESDVRALAGIYIKKNLKAVDDEGARLNLGPVDDPVGVTGPAPYPDRDKVVEVQQLAREIQRADDMLKDMLSLPVGEDAVDTSKSSGGGPPEQIPRVYKFAPDHPPPAGPPQGREKEFAKWDEVDKHYKAVSAARSLYASRNPALFAAAQGNTEEAGKIAQMSPEQAAQRLREILGQTRRAICDAEPKVAGPKAEIDWREFTPIHEQLWKGMPAASGQKWDTALAKDVSKGLIGNYQMTKFWEKLALGSLAAAAFIFSEIATGGMATFMWAAAGTAVGTGIAAGSIKDYTTLKGVAQASTSKETQIVSQEQVDEAKVGAVLDAAFAFLDILQAAKILGAGAKAAGAAARGASRKALEELATLAPDKAAQAVRDAVRELGPRETIRRCPGKTTDDLIKLVGGEATQEGKALREVSEDISVLPARAGADSGPVVLTEAARRLAAKAHPVYQQWGALSPGQRLSRLGALTNEEFVTLGTKELKWVIDDKLGDLAQLDYPNWQVKVKALESADRRFPGLYARKITEEQFSELLNTVAHEAEHAKDWFAMAQREAMEGAGPKIIAEKLDLRADIAKDAFDVQKGTKAGVKLVGGSEREAEVGRMWESVYGDAAKARNKLLTDQSKAFEEMQQAEAEFKTFQRQPPADADRVRTYEAWQQKVSAHAEVDRQYRALAEEVTAFRAGDTAGAAMQERFELLREYKTAVQTDRAAATQLAAAEAEAAKAARAGEIPYPTQVDLSLAETRYLEAFEHLKDVEHAMANVNKGKAP